MMTNVGMWKMSRCYQSTMLNQWFYCKELIMFVRGRKCQLTETMCVFYYSSHLMFDKIKWYLPKPQYQGYVSNQVLFIWINIQDYAHLWVYITTATDGSHWMYDIFTWMHMFSMMLNLIIYVFFYIAHETERQPKRATSRNVADVN